MKKLSLLLLTILALRAHAAEHVVLVVWDGLRPDSVNGTNTPTLAKLAREGVFFANHHAVYVSSTEVNGVTLATGAYPARTGILANREYRTAIDPLKSVAIESPETIRKADELTTGHYLGLPTLPEILRAAGRTVAVVGAKPIAKLFDRKRPESFVSTSKFAAPNTKTDIEATSRLIGGLWDNGVPSFSLLWLSEPDVSQHDSGLGSPKALAALRGSDQNLARVFDELQAKGVRDKTDVLVVSDHGFSTASRTVDLAAVLTNAGFAATREFKKAPKPGEILIVELGGSAMFYVIGHDPVATRKLVEFLQQQDFTGVIFTREPLPGTFRLEAARMDTIDAPDIVVALRWSADPGSNGVLGMVVSDAGRAPGQGVHASLSRFDMRNTLIAVGPDFRRGMTNSLPTGNADVAPTILSILGVKPEHATEGRELSEALVGRAFPKVPVVLRTLEATCDVGARRWHQYLRVIEVAGVTYLDEGNGSSQVVHSEEKPVTP